MAALDDLKALGPRLDAVAAAIGTDTATAVANATAAANQQISTLEATATQAETDLANEVTDLTAKVATLETAVGITPPAA